MKNFKVLFVPFLSFALIFSSNPALAQNLVNTLPDFYYLEDLNDESLLIHACSRSKIKDHSTVANLSTIGLDCAAVAEVSKVELYSFLSEAIDEAENHFNREKPYYDKMATTLGLVGLSGVGFYFWGFMTDFQKPKNAFVLMISGAILGAGGFSSAAGYSGERANKKRASIIPQTLEGQVHMGLVGRTSDGREEILQLFTDFLNDHGNAL